MGTKIHPTIESKHTDEDKVALVFPCDLCHKPRSQSDHYRCLECADFDVCDMCFEKRVEVEGHKNGHAFVHFRMPKELFGDPVNDNHRDVTLKKLTSRFEHVKHQNIMCNGCEAENIVGIRFKCDTCPNFDLCLKCMKKKVETGHHTGNHPLVVIGDNHLKQIEWDDIEIGEQLGQGGFGKLYNLVATNIFEKLYNDSSNHYNSSTIYSIM